MDATKSALSLRDSRAADALATLSDAPSDTPCDTMALRDLARSVPANGNGPGSAMEEEAPLSGTRVVDAPDGVSEDTALVRAACARDPRAQTRIWRKYAPLVRARLRRSIGVRDLDDLVQEVFLRLFECLPALRQPSALRSFIIGISIRVAGTELRRRGSRWWLCLMPTDADCEAPSATYRFDEEGHEALARFDRILAQLSPQARRMFELRYIENKGLAAVADAMGISLATAKRHLARAHAQVVAMVTGDEVLRTYACEEHDASAVTAGEDDAPDSASPATTSPAIDQETAAAALIEPAAPSELIAEEAQTESGATTVHGIARVRCANDVARADAPRLADVVSLSDFRAACNHRASPPARRARRAPSRASPHRQSALTLRRRRLREQPTVNAVRRRDLRFDPEAVINDLRHFAAA
jgi:RNA polymerase sigma-70 factor (ECF subfamily)